MQESPVSRAVYIHWEETLAGEPPHEQLGRCEVQPFAPLREQPAMKRAQALVRAKLREGYTHAGQADHWTILKRGNDVFRVRMETRNTDTVGLKTRNPILWTPRNEVPA